MNRKKKSGTVVTIILIVVLLAGLGIFLYPRISDEMNRYGQKKVVTEYEKAAEGLSAEDTARMLAEAEAYNEALLSRRWRLSLNEEETVEYEALLDVTGTGIMGYVEIPSIDVCLPVYHGTDRKMLQQAIIHYEGSSLPVGGIGTHTVISGHRGLPSARLFTDIDQLMEGDHFRITVLDRTVTYEVDQVLTVLPSEKDDLKIDPEQDYCTLMTCTPYGINTHRLLVRGTRVPNDEQDIRKAGIINTRLLILLLPAAVLLTILIILLIRIRKSRTKTTDNGT